MHPIMIDEQLAFQKRSAPDSLKEETPTPTIRGGVITAGHNHTELPARKNRHVTSHRQGRRTVAAMYFTPGWGAVATATVGLVGVAGTLTGTTLALRQGR